MPGAPSQIAPHDGRGHERIHLFLAATLYSRSGSSPVHVRNFSPNGALIEGAIVPRQGDEVTLKRGRLTASGTIVWKAGRKAGIAFSTALYTSDWMARPPSSHQGRADELIRAIRSGAGTWPGDASGGADGASGCSVEDELMDLRDSLAELEKGLAGDVILIATHPEVQLLDVALQSVDRLLRTVRQQ